MKKILLALFIVCASLSQNASAAEYPEDGRYHINEPQLALEMLRTITQAARLLTFTSQNANKIAIAASLAAGVDIISLAPQLCEDVNSIRMALNADEIATINKNDAILSKEIEQKINTLLGLLFLEKGIKGISLIPLLITRRSSNAVVAVAGAGIIAAAFLYYLRQHKEHKLVSAIQKKYHTFDACHADENEATTQTPQPAETPQTR